MSLRTGDGGLTWGSERQLAALPDSGCQGALTRWEAGKAILATSPDNGGCRAGCKEFCDWKGSGHAIDEPWQKTCDSGVCCPGGLDSAGGSCPGGGSTGRCNLTVFMVRACVCARPPLRRPVLC